MPPKAPLPPRPGFDTELRRRKRWKLMVAKQETIPWNFHSTTFGLDSKFFTGLTGFATFLILAILTVILANILINGWSGLSWRFITSGTEKDMFDVDKAGVLPMIVGTAKETKSEPASTSNRATALTSPTRATCTRSSRGSPRPSKRRAM